MLALDSLAPGFERGVDAPNFLEPHARALPEIAYEAEMLRRDGTTFPVEVRGRFLQFRAERVRIAVVRDITEKRAREAELKALSLRDALTGLYNRRGFLELAGHELKAAARNRQRCALFYADLDGMKQINDQLGHALGSMYEQKRSARQLSSTRVRLG